MSERVPAGRSLLTLDACGMVAPLMVQASSTAVPCWGSCSVPSRLNYENVSRMYS